MEQFGRRKTKLVSSRKNKGRRKGHPELFGSKSYLSYLTLPLSLVLRKNSTIIMYLKDNFLE
jgi:hypothetical protein